MQRHGRYNEQLRVDVGTRRGRGDKVVMVSLLTCPSLTSCLLSCKSMTRAGCRGNEKVPILGELKKIATSFLQTAHDLHFLPS